MITRTHWSENETSVQGTIDGGKLTLVCHKTKKTAQTDVVGLVGELCSRIQSFDEIETQEHLDRLLYGLLLELSEAITPPMLRGDIFEPVENSKCTIDCKIDFTINVDLLKVKAGADVIDCLQVLNIDGVDKK